MLNGERYEAEDRIVDLLIDRIVDRVTDRSGDEHPPPWEPKRHVKVGVLRARFERAVTNSTPKTQAGDDTESDPDGSDLAAEAEQEAQEVELSEPESLGIDFLVTPAASQPLKLEVEVDVAVYQPIQPTLSQVRRLLANSVTAQSSDSPPGKVANVPWQPGWKRTNVTVRSIQLTVPDDSAHISDFGILNRQLEQAVNDHFQVANAARPLDKRQVVPESALASESDLARHVAANTDQNWQVTYPTAEVSAFAEALPTGELLVSVNLVNLSSVDDGRFQDHTLYDARFSVRVVGGGDAKPMEFHLAPDDYRHRPFGLEPGHGRRCVAETTDDGGLFTQTVPVNSQPRSEPRTDHIQASLQWERLAEDPMPTLSAISTAMLSFKSEWEKWLAGQDDEQVKNEARADLDHFIEERRVFELGITALQADPRMMQAFKLANRSFALANADASFDSWRLFQLVYIVSHLPALAARAHRNNSDFTEQLEHVDVLWFPTGGGKTEAYLGLILAAAFYDRLRGKVAGVTAWLKFPLRMLSVQQLSRVARILTVAEHVRTTDLDSLGEPFELGYLVGQTNTPNQLRYENGWWPGFDSAMRTVEKEPTSFDDRRLIAQCPFCQVKGHVGLDVDATQYRLRHICRSCNRHLLVHMSDDEIYRYQPTVVVSTIDKVTGFSLFGEFTSFTRGPKHRCPQHGYFAFGSCPVSKVSTKTNPKTGEPVSCAVKESEYEDVAWEDPVPALTVQDELHLVREELGTFAGHFESLIAHLQTAGPSALPSKVLGATATIEQYEDQLRQVYGRRPRRFPSPGYARHVSFYVRELPTIRRKFLGLMPSGGGTAKVEIAAMAQSEALQQVQRWQDDLSSLRAALGSAAGPMTDDDLQDLLFDYEVSLGFVNAKAHGTLIADELTQLSDDFAGRGKDPIEVEVLTGEVTVTQLAGAIARIEDEKRTDPRAERLRALVGTSVVSHGVDLERLNVMVMAGLPSTTADYIQATSRSGRSHVGLVVTIYDDYQRRESSTFTHFHPSHRLIDMLVEPVPVNRFARRAADRTLPGTVMALLWDLARDPQHGAPAEGIRRTKQFQKWWNTSAATLDSVIVDRIKASYRSPVPGVNPPKQEDELADSAAVRWAQIERKHVAQFNTDRTVQLFANKVMTSLRDVDEGVGFEGFGHSRTLYRHMFPERF